MTVLNKLDSADLKLLRRLLTDPGMRQTNLANELDVTRSMVNQIWRELVRTHDLRVKSSVDYGQVGMRLLFGWAQASETSDRLTDFCAWLESNAHVTDVVKSAMSSTTNAAIYFEAVIPSDAGPFLPRRYIDWSYDRSNDFVLTFDVASEVSNHLNLGLFDGSQWNLEEGFRFEVSTGAVRDYAEILPAVSSLRQSKPSAGTIESMAVVSALEDNYHATAREVAQCFSRLGLQRVPERTLRRRVNLIREKMIMPYIHLDNIGLTQRALVCVKSSSQEPTLSRLLHVQASTLPKARVASGSTLAVLNIDLPSLKNWLALTSSLAQITKGSAETLTFIAQKSATRKALESVILGVPKKRSFVQSSQG